MSKLVRCSTICLLVILTSTFLLSLNLSVSAQDEEIPPEIISPIPIGPYIPPTSSADQATVILSATEGGTTEPAPGTYYYWNTTVIRLTAVPNEGYRFGYWAISGAYTPGHSIPPQIIGGFGPGEIEVDGESIGIGTAGSIPIPTNPTQSTYDSLVATQNPLNVLCGYAYTFQYKAVFFPTTPTGTERATAIVVVKETVGGTTNPGPGTYTFAEGSSITLTATPSEGQEFQYWIASGSGVSGHGESTVLMDNPLTILCGIGYSYDYLPVFAPVGTTTPSEGIPTEYLYAIIVVLAIVAVIAIAFALMFKSKK